MIEKVKTLSNWVLQGAILLCWLALPLIAVFDTAFLVRALDRYVIDPLIALAWLALGLDVLILLPLSLSRRLRPGVGAGLYLSSLVFGALTFVAGLLNAYAVWGSTAVVVGLILLGGAVVPIALLADLVNGLWSPFFFLLGLTAVTVLARFGGIAISSRGFTTE